MKSLRFFFLALYGAGSSNSDGLPEEELPGFGQAFMMPASFLLQSGILPENGLARLLEDPSRARCSEFSLALWSSQNHLSEQLLQLGSDTRGMPPISGRALEAFFLPSGRFWLGAYFPIEGSLVQTQDRVQKSFNALTDSNVLATSTVTFPWLPDFSRGSGGWALAANQILGAKTESLGFTPKKSPRSSILLDSSHSSKTSD